ncbi:FYVE-domain-containing protein [Ganoderma leucocontextum]|nr:FYVE-domain-containing protein [Ganoderma leucocontextum]
MENQPYVPYQAYKSKRHNRVLSNPQAAPNGTPPPTQARPNSIVANGYSHIEPILPHAANGVVDSEKRSIAILNGRNPPQRPLSMIETFANLRQEPTPSPPPPSDPIIEKMVAEQPMSKPVEKAVEKPLLPPVDELPPLGFVPASPVRQPTPVRPQHVSPPPPSAVPLPSSPISPSSLSQTSSPKANGKAIAQSTAAGPSIHSPVSPDKPISSPRKTSTFRHVPLRPTAARTILPTSPLSRPTSMIAQNTASMLASPTPAARRLNEPTSGVSSAASTPAMRPQDRALPAIPAFELLQHQPSSLPATAASSPTPIAPIHAPTARASTLGTSLVQDIVPPVHPLPSSASPSLTPSTSTSSAFPSAPRTPVRSPAPYRPGFQPKGVYRPRTDEFIEARNCSRDVGRIERTRLERRLEKLINLHFPPPGQRKAEAAEARPKQENRRASSFWDLDLSDLKNKSAGDLWREVVQSQASQSGKNDVRVAEQKITPWEEDSSVSQCPLCTASFHPLTNRKHHCRLCGRIICSLPVKHPQRPESCSLLFVVDQSTGRIEEVGEGVDYGVRRRTTASPGKPQKREVLSEDEKFLKGVRICRDCKPVLVREQYRQEMGVVPLFTRLYDALISLEKEIEDELPIFQELVVNLAKQERPTPEATAARKRLLEAFAQYDALAKRIRQLPCPPSGSQDRIQGAVIARANLFLQKNMFPLQSLPKPNGKKTGGSSPSPSPGPPEDQIIDPDSEVARILQPLLEQEALLETFVEEAKAHRKFEDVRTLKSNLREIRAEIERIIANAEEQAPARRTSARTSAV